MHSFHLVHVPATVGARTLLQPPAVGRDGLRHIECLSLMRLGAPVVSPDRWQLRRIAIFAEWESEGALDDFLATDGLGGRAAQGWHVRLEFLRRWGQVAELAHLPEIAGRSDPAEPIVAVTLARARLPDLARFIHWGRPVERQVRDDPATTLALAAMRPPRTFSTFSVWHTTRAMTDMVHGRSRVEAPRRHADAMVERERRDFHREFTTLRFRPLAEHGSWEARTGIVPTG